MVVDALLAAATGSVRLDPAVRLDGPATLRSAYPVSALATASVGAAGAALADVLAALGGRRPAVVVHRALADAWFAGPAVGADEPLPGVWDPLSVTYRARDGWVRLHTNAPHHRAAALAALGVDADPAAVAAAIVERDGDEVERAVVAGGGAAAALRDPGAWARHPQGAAVAAEPLVAWSAGAPSARASTWDPQPGAPLAGLRVLDLTRVLAGPTATQLLAALGADVLRIDPPDWDEPATLPFVMWGKRTARLDARTARGGATLRDLLTSADVLVHGYRAGALDHLGLDAAARARLRPGLVDVSLRAYGFTGPWAGRRGFDSLVQVSAGIAHAGMVAAGADRPVALPVQALDVATGYLAAAAALAGLAQRVRTGTGSSWRLSLARTAAELERARALPAEQIVDVAPPARPTLVATPYGRLALPDPPLTLDGVELRVGALGAPLGRDTATWR